MKPMNPCAVATAIALSTAPVIAAAQDGEDSHHGIDQIVVTATPLDRMVEDLAQPTSVLLGDELVKKQSTSIAETLARLPGLTTQRINSRAQDIVVRGLAGNFST